MQANRPQGSPQRFVYNKPSLVLFPGSGIAGEIGVNHKEATPVVDELTARRNVCELSQYLNSTARQRHKTWDQYWERKVNLSQRIVQLENEAYMESQQLYADEGFSDDEHSGKRHRIQPAPLIVPSKGTFDMPLPEPVIIPDPRRYRSS